MVLLRSKSGALIRYEILDDEDEDPTFDTLKGTDDGDSAISVDDTDSKMAQSKRKQKITSSSMSQCKERP